MNSSTLKGAGLALAAISLSALGVAAQAEQVPGYGVWNDRAPAMNSYGECWRTPGSPTTEPLAECGDVMAKEADSDGDGVPDSRDRCPGTPKGVRVDDDGCPLDSDGDGVPDYKDKCPGTPRGAKVDRDGCEIMASLTIDLVADEFDFDSAKLKPDMKSALEEVARKVKASKGDEHLLVVGHTDSVGPESYNQGLSERRAKAAADYLVSQGVRADRVSTKGMGEAQPIASNATREGRAKNRRVEVLTK